MAFSVPLIPHIYRWISPSFHRADVWKIHGKGISKISDFFGNFWKTRSIANKNFPKFSQFPARCVPSEKVCFWNNDSLSLPKFSIPADPDAIQKIPDFRFAFCLPIALIQSVSNIIPTHPCSVAVNHAGLWIRRHQFESGQGYLYHLIPVWNLFYTAALHKTGL